MTLKLNAHHLKTLHLLPDENEEARTRIYGQAFSQNYRGIVSKIYSDGNQPVEIVEGFDDICAQCPYQRETSCANPTSTATMTEFVAYDRKVAEKYGVKIGEVLSADTLLSKVGSRLSLSLRLESFLAERENVPIEEYIGSIRA